jgi:hypothetical protein
MKASLLIVSSLAILLIGFISWCFYSSGTKPVHRRSLEVSNALKAQINLEVQRYSDFELNDSMPPWTLIHGMIGRSHDFRIRTSSGPKLCSDVLLDELTAHPKYKRSRLVTHPTYGYVFSHGRDGTPMEFEDHQSDFVSAFLSCGVDLNRRIVIDDHAPNIRLSDIWDTELLGTSGFTDVSWTVWALLMSSPDRTWTNRFGERYSLDTLVRQHLANEEQGVACFGTHWRMGLAQVVLLGRQHLSPETYRLAENRLAELVAVERNVTASGMFGGADSRLPPSEGNQDAALLLYQGHTLEWLMVAFQCCSEISAFDDAQQWVNSGATALQHLLGSRNCSDMNYGSYSHAINGLRAFLHNSDGVE